MRTLLAVCFGLVLGLGLGSNLSGLVFAQWAQGNNPVQQGVNPGFSGMNQSQYEMLQQGHSILQDGGVGYQKGFQHRNPCD